MTWLFTSKDEYVLKKSSKNATLKNLSTRLVGLAYAGADTNEDDNSASQSKQRSQMEMIELPIICNLFCDDGDVLPCTSREWRQLSSQNFQSIPGKRVLAVSSNVKGALVRGRVRLQNAFRVVKGKGKPATATYRLVPLSLVRQEEDTTTAFASSAAQKHFAQKAATQTAGQLGRLLSRDKLLNAYLDKLTVRLVKRL